MTRTIAFYVYTSVYIKHMIRIAGNFITTVIAVYMARVLAYIMTKMILL